MDNEQFKSNLTSSKHWFRLVFMLLFAVVLYLAAMVVGVLVALQFLFSLITGADNHHLRKFGYSLSTYIYDVLKFLSYNSEEKPFPFADWPAESIPDPVVVNPGAVAAHPVATPKPVDSSDAQLDTKKDD